MFQNYKMLFKCTKDDDGEDDNWLCLVTLNSFS